MKNPMDALTQGVYLIGVRADDVRNLMTAAWVTQISSRAVLIAVGKSHYTAELIRQAGHFSISVLAEGQREIAKQCGTVSGRNVDKLSGLSLVESQTGDPMLSNAVARISCRVMQIETVLDHILICGEVIDAELLGGEPMQYRAWEFFA